MRRFLFFPALNLATITGPEAYNVICIDCLTFAGMASSPPDAPVTWSQISGRPLTITNGNTLAPTFCGLANNVLDINPIVVRATIPGPLVDTTFDVKISTVPQSPANVGPAYSNTRSIEIDNRQTSVTSTTAAAPLYLSKAYVATTALITWPAPADTLYWHSSTWLKLSPTTGTYDPVETFPAASVPRGLLDEAPSWFKIRFNYVTNGVLRHRDSDVLYYSSIPTLPIADDSGSLSPGYGLASTTVTPTNLTFSTAFTNQEYVDPGVLAPAYSANTTILINTPLPFYSLLVNLEPTAEAAPLSPGYSLTQTTKTNTPYTWNSGGLVLG
jgi:hypothetical protein